MGMLYVQDKTAVKLKAIATKERRTLTVVVEMLLEAYKKHKKEA